MFLDWHFCLEYVSVHLRQIADTWGLESGKTNITEIDLQDLGAAVTTGEPAQMSVPSPGIVTFPESKSKAELVSATVDNSI